MMIISLRYTDTHIIIVEKMKTEISKLIVENARITLQRENRKATVK